MKRILAVLTFLVLTLSLATAQRLPEGSHDRIITNSRSLPISTRPRLRAMKRSPSAC